MVITTDNLVKIYNTRHVVDGVSISVEQGSVVGLLGPNGAGKTTTFYMIVGIEKPDAGTVMLDGKDISAMPMYERARAGIGYLPQEASIFSKMTVEDNIMAILETTDLNASEREAKMNALLDEFRLNHVRKSEGKALSGGERRRVEIARALATQPKVLLCDEATSALDPNTTHQILELIRDINQKLGITVVVITHQMSVVKTICNHVAILDGGVVAEKGLVSEVFAAPKSAAGRRLVFPGGADALVSDPQAVRRVRLTFRDSVTTGTPLVARLASCTVISASTQKLSEEVYGSMLLGIPSGQFQRAMDYIDTMSNIRVEEVDGHVQ